MLRIATQPVGDAAALIAEVERDNAPARRLQAGLRFPEAYGYPYRRAAARAQRSRR